MGHEVQLVDPVFFIIEKLKANLCELGFDRVRTILDVDTYNSNVIAIECAMWDAYRLLNTLYARGWNEEARSLDLVMSLRVCSHSYRLTAPNFYN